MASAKPRRARRVIAGVLSGARFLTDITPWTEFPEKPSGTGHFFLLIDPQRLLGAEIYTSAIARFRHLIRSTPAAEAAQPVQIPGER